MLLQRGYEIFERDIFENKLTILELSDILKYCDIDYIFATRSPSVKKLELVLDEMTTESKMNYMIEEPKLIKRPMVYFEGEFFAGADIKKYLM
ncbi:MAG TPA: hypothetical protein DEZ08_02645 [Dehalococcoidia bacterium]|jgi:arsenate reductase-like glutaredoxin family protein|nr:hypothetical protein [Dehalococcoidia bacterium]|tara:strand:- start:733 stop:1011 length:279 start_codon:yes stop_codon:yes gene_type:complete